MALVCNGSGHLVRDYVTGVTSITNYTILLAVKRTTDQTGQRTLLTLRPGSEASGHNVLLYNGGFGSDAAPVLRANYGAADADPNTLLPLNTWMWVALQGNGTTAWIKQLSGGSWVSASCAQVDFAAVVEIFRLADTGEGTSRLTAKFSHIREWNGFLTDGELTTETNSLTPVITTGLVSAKRGVGANLSAALTGESGPAFTTSGTVTLDSDEPTFTATAEATVAQTLADFSQTATASTINNAVVAQTMADFTNDVTLGVTLEAAVSQTLEDFSQSVTAGIFDSADVTQTLEDFTLEATVDLVPLPGTFVVSQVMDDFTLSAHAQASIAAPTPPQYLSITCGAGSYGTPVNSAHRLLKREFHRPWPTK